MKTQWIYTGVGRSSTTFCSSQCVKNQIEINICEFFPSESTQHRLLLVLGIQEIEQHLARAIPHVAVGIKDRDDAI